MNAPSLWSDDARFTESAAAFRAFFDELREAFVERDTLFTQLELALLCREHVLIIGPPGTAKSAIAGAVLGRIVDEKTGRPSLFSKQLAENTVQTDLIGPVDFKVLTETGRTEYLTEEGMLGATHAFLDEVFDGRDMLLRSILNVLHERELKHGRKVTPGRCECAVMTSNRYLSEVLQRSPETLQAFADRVSFICFAPKSFSRRASRGQMLHRAQTGQRPALHVRLTLQQLDVLQAAVDAVEVPPLVAEGLEDLGDALERELLAQVTRLPDYVPTKYFSQRSMVKALWALKAGVVRDRLYRRPERPLVAEPGDLETLRHFFLLGGPAEQELEALFKLAGDPRERAQLDIIRVEHLAFTQAYTRLAPGLQTSLEREAADLRAKDDLASAESLTRAWSAAPAVTLANSLRAKLLPGPRHAENRKPLLKAGELMLQALTQRLARGMAQEEGRGSLALTRSFGDALELSRRVPEFQARLPELATGVAALCRQAASMVALAAEGSEFDDALKLEGLTALTVTLTEELGALAELAQVVTTISPEEGAPLKELLAASRERAASALQRRADTGFSAAPRAGAPLEQLVAESRRLNELESALVKLSPAARGLRSRLLAPLAAEYASSALSGATFTRLEEFQRLMQVVVDNLNREGADPGAALRFARARFEARLREHIERLGAQRAVIPAETKALSGEAYQYYRANLATQAEEGEFAALTGIDALLARVGLAPLPAQFRELVSAAELRAVGLRVRYLSGWWRSLEEALRNDTAISPRQRFDALVKTRFPTLVTREGELVRLESSLGRLGAAAAKGEATSALTAELAGLERAFAAYSRQLIDARAGK